MLLIMNLELSCLSATSGACKGARSDWNKDGARSLGGGVQATSHGSG